MPTNITDAAAASGAQTQPIIHQAIPRVDILSNAAVSANGSYTLTEAQLAGAQQVALAIAVGGASDPTGILRVSIMDLDPQTDLPIGAAGSVDVDLTSLPDTILDFTTRTRRVKVMWVRPDPGDTFAGVSLSANFHLVADVTASGGGGTVDQGAAGAEAWPVSVASLPLPAGAATEATLTALSAKLPSALVGGRLDVNIGAPAALPVTDNGGSLTVDGAVTANAGSGTFVVGDGGGSLTVDDGGGSLTVDGTVAISGTVPVSGTVTANAGTGTFVVGDGGGAISVDDNGSSLTVDTPQLPAALASGRLDVSIGACPATLPISAASLPLPTGAATETTLAAVSGKLPAALVSGRLSVDGSGVTQPVSIAAAVAVTDNAGSLTVDGTVAVSSLPVLPSGSNTIGKVDQGTGGASAWKVDGSAVTQPVSAASLPLQSDRTASGTMGAVNAAVAISSVGAGLITWVLPAGLVGTVVFEATADDATWFQVEVYSAEYGRGNTIPSDGSPANGHFGIAGWSQVRLRVSAYTSGSVTVYLRATAGTPGLVATYFAETPTVVAWDGGSSLTVDGAVALTAGASLIGKVQLRDPGNTVDVGDATNPLRVDPTGTTAQPVSAAVGSPVAARLSTGAAFYDAAKTGQLPSALVGGRLDVNIGASAAIPVTDNSGSLTVDGTVTASNTAGDVAHDGVDSGNPVKVGGKAAVSALPTAVANNDRANLATDRYGRQLVAPVDHGLMSWKANTYQIVQTGVAVWTPQSGKVIVVTGYSIAAFGTTSGRVTLWFGAVGDTTYTETTDKPVFDGNFNPTVNSAPGTNVGQCFIPADAADRILRITTDATISVRVVVHGYEITP